MNNLVEHIVDKEYDKANEIFESKIDNILVQKLNEAKKMVAAKMCEQIPAFMGAAAGNSVKLRRDVLEEDDIEEALDPSEKTELSVEKGTPKPKPGSTHYKNVQEKNLNEVQGTYRAGYKYDPVVKSTNDRGSSWSQTATKGIDNKPDFAGKQKEIRSLDNTLSTDGKTSSSMHDVVSSKVLRPDRNDGRGGDYDVSTSRTVTQRSVQEEDDIEEGVIQVPLRGGGKTNVPVQGSVVNQSVSGATINKTGTSPVSSAEREPVGSGDRISVNKAVSLTQKPDPIGQRQAALHAGNAKAAVKGGYSPRYMPSDPDFTQRAAAARAKSANMSGGAVGNPNLREEEQLDEARIGIVKARIRGGKIERRKKVSGVEGYKLQDGKLKRMSPAERRRRKLGQKRGKLKRKAKLRQALMKRKRSLRKRASIGL